MIETERLLLRQWDDQDLIEFAALNADKAVMQYFPALLSKQQSDEMARKIAGLIESQGWGLWAVEVPGVTRFAGFTGLHNPQSDLPFNPCIEIGWRFARQHWGYGYATEAATAALNCGFAQLGLEEIVSFTTVNNIRSQAVMSRKGMKDSGENFMHPDIAKEHPLCEHVLFRLTQTNWASNAN